MAEETPDWSARLTAWRASGKSGLAWCRDNGISYDQLKYWQKKLQPPVQHEQSKHPGQFVPLRFSSTPLRIECNGAFVHISSGFDPVLLQAVVSVLREC